MPGNGTGVIVTSGPVLGSAGNMTGRWREKVTFASIQDGTSNTFLAGEMHIPQEQINVTPFNGPVFNGSELVAHSRLGGSGIPILSGRDDPGAIFGFGSAHPGTCNFVRADGSTSSMSNNLDTITLADFCHRADGNVIIEQ